jgi:hypothetical protein
MVIVLIVLNLAIYWLLNKYIYLYIFKFKNMNIKVNPDAF